MEGAFLPPQSPQLERRPPPHVLLFPLPLQGHINPFLHLGEQLSASGILSTLLVLGPSQLVSTADARPPSQHHLLRFAGLDLPPETNAKLSSGKQSPEIFEIIDTQLVGPLRDFILSSHVVTNTHDNAGIMASKEPDEIVTLPPISCLVSDTFMPWTVDLAQEMGIPRVEMWTGSATAYAFTAAIPQLISKGLLPYKQGTQDLALDLLPPGIPASRLGHVPVGLLTLDHPSHPVFQSVTRAFSRAADSDRLLMNSVGELEAGAVSALRSKNVKITPIGPLLSLGNKKNNTSLLDEAQLRCLRWLDTQEAKSVVYVAFGSAGFLSEEEVREMAMALEIVGRPFLWAIRDGSAIESLPESFRSGSLPAEKGLIVSWAPQRHVLEHKSVGVFVSHCGWNSTLESAWSGVPMVGCPRVSEQNTNMWLAQEWGIGVPGVDTMMGGVGSLRSATLTQALEHIMGTPGIDTHEGLYGVQLRKNAVEVTATARAAVSPSGASIQAFQEFVKDLLIKC